MKDEPEQLPDLPPGAVIAAMDLSDRSAEVLSQAHAWAKRLGAPLVVCHAMPRLDAIMPLLPHLYQPVPEVSERDVVIDGINDQADALGIGDFDSYILTGSPHAAIIKLAVESSPRLLVIGATQQGAVSHMMLGSTAGQLVRHAPCPVLVARQSAPDGPVVAATDLSDPALQAVRAAAREAARRGAQLFVVHALHLPRQLAVAAIEPTAGLDAKTAASLKGAAERVIGELVARLGIAGHGIVIKGRAARAIPQAAQELGASLIVVATHGYTGLERIALGSSAEAIIRAAPCSVLVEKLLSATNP